MPLSIPTQTITSGPFTGPGLPHNSQVPDVISGAGGTASGRKQVNLTADSTPDELSSLQPLTLKQGAGDPGVGFPGLIMKEDQSKSLAVHMYPNLDSARVENMGRNPAIFHVKAIFTNNIYPGQNETWTPGILFPNTFIAIYQILLDNNDIVFTHPVLGDITCQVRSWGYELNPKIARDGAVMDIELVETIGDNNPLAQQLKAPPGVGMQAAANALDTAIGAAPQSVHPPGLSLSQFFGQVTNLISQAIAIPNKVVSAIQTPINAAINGVESIAGTYVGSVGYWLQFGKATVQGTKNTVLNSPLQQAIANDQTSIGNPPYSSPNYSPPPAYDQSSLQAGQSLQALNNTPSTNAFQLMDKLMRALIDLQQHYINQNNAQCTPIIEGIRALLLQVQQQQSALSLNTNNQSVLVFNYVTQTNITWMQLALVLNNTIDDLMGLNQGLVTDIWIPANTTINYFQA